MLPSAKRTVLLFPAHAAFYHSITRTGLRKLKSTPQSPKHRALLLISHQVFGAELSSFGHRPCWGYTSLWHRVIPRTCGNPPFPPLHMLWQHADSLGSRGDQNLCPQVFRDSEISQFVSWLSVTSACYLQGFNEVLTIKAQLHAQVANILPRISCVKYSSKVKFLP